jgi:hypothetical protein
MSGRTPVRTPEMFRRGEFWVRGCRACHHPGGLHVIEQWEPRVTSCRCCTDCPGYEDGEFMRWSNQQTAAARDR